MFKTCYNFTEQLMIISINDDAVLSQHVGPVNRYLLLKNSSLTVPGL